MTSVREFLQNTALSPTDRANMYSTKKFSWDSNTNKVFVTVEFLDNIGHTVDIEFNIPDDMKGAKMDIKYLMVNDKIQIDANGNLLTTNATSMRFSWTPLDSNAVRWAEQSDLDKWCLSEPVAPFDWNVAVWKAVSSFLQKNQRGRPKPQH